MANNPLVRRDPLNELMRFDPFGNIDDFFRDFRMVPALRSLDVDQRMRIDMSETENAYTINAEIPGVKKDEIKVSIDGNQVSISAEVRKESEDKSGNVLRSERYYGQQYRSFALPQEVDDTKAEAKYHDGILQLTLPKRPGTGGKQLAIH